LFYSLNFAGTIRSFLEKQKDKNYGILLVSNYTMQLPNVGDENGATTIDGRKIKIRHLPTGAVDRINYPYLLQIFIFQYLFFDSLSLIILEGSESIVQGDGKILLKLKRDLIIMFMRSMHFIIIWGITIIDVVAILLTPTIRFQSTFSPIFFPIYVQGTTSNEENIGSVTCILYSLLHDLREAVYTETHVFSWAFKELIIIFEKGKSEREKRTIKGKRALIHILYNIKINGILFGWSAIWENKRK
ncbi:hypothetical protein ACJX0J_008442, partial [Zea mays]